MTELSLASIDAQIQRLDALEFWDGALDGYYYALLKAMRAVFALEQGDMREEACEVAREAFSAALMFPEAKP